MDFHPNGRFAYVINELDLTMTAYAYDAKTGLLRELQILPTLPAAADKVGASCADVHVHRTGRFLYGSNRGHDSIVIYRLGDDGRMTLVGHESRGIKRPRNFTIDPTGTLMLVANQDAANVTIFRIDQNKGHARARRCADAGRGESIIRRRRHACRGNRGSDYAHAACVAASACHWISAQETSASSIIRSRSSASTSRR